MAGAGYKLFNTGDVLLASEVNTYLQQQVTMVFASAAARTTALSGVLAEGMMSYLQDTNSVEVYNGTSWVNVGNAGDITEVQAGTGISVASGTGPIPVVTNSMATEITAKGDLIVGTGSGTFDNLAVGTNGYTLVADSGETTGLKWAAPSTGAMVLVKARTTFSGVTDTSTTFDSVFTSTYRAYVVIIEEIISSQNSQKLRWQHRYSGTSQTAYYGLSRMINYLGTETDYSVSGTHIELLEPYNADYSFTNVTVTGTGQNGSGRYMPIAHIGFTSAKNGPVHGAFQAQTARAYDGFQLSIGSGTISGAVTIYGLAVS